MSKPDGGPAFQLQEQMQSAVGDVTAWLSQGQPGMSLRDYFAGQAVTGIILHPHATDGSPLECARVAYLIADAMIEARAK